MNIFEKVKGFVFVSDEIEPEEKTEPVKKEKEEKELVDTKPANKELYNDLLSTIQNGVYLQFFDMVDSLKEDISDDGACYRAAFKAIKKSNPISVEKLMLKVDDCITSLDEKKKEFQEGVREKTTEMDVMDKEIQELQEKIAELTKEKESKQNEVELAKKKIQSVSIEFDKTTKAVEYMLLQNKKKISNYLKGKGDENE